MLIGLETGEPLGLRAKRLGVPDGLAFSVGTGRSLRGRIVVSDPARAESLFPSPSEETLRAIKRFGAEVMSRPAGQ